MNSSIQSASPNLNTQNLHSMPSASHYQQKLKKLGDEIEAIAEQMKDLGLSAKSEELHELGDRVEHFCDTLDLSSPAEKSQSTVPHSQISG